MSATPSASAVDLPKVNVSMSIFAKPYQTCLSVVSLLACSGRHIDTFYLQFEPMGSEYDKMPPYVIADYLTHCGYTVKSFQPEIWIECDAYDPTRISEPAYRHAIRYQTAFEFTEKQYLFVTHNDVLVKKDIIGAMLNQIGDAFAIGQIGQCWNCPARHTELMQELGLGPACTPATHTRFKPDYATLERLYTLARERGMKIRPYWEGWHTSYHGELGWPLPECRVNEWACLVDMAQTQQITCPYGDIPPFGAFEACGSVALDIDVAWFRELYRRGLHAKHMDIAPYLTHWVGNNKMDRRSHMLAEDNAKQILEKHFTSFTLWCKAQKNGLF